MDDEYRVVQSLVRNKYRAYDAAGDLVLKGKQKMMQMKEEFPFVDADDNPVFTVKAGGILDVAGNYTLTDDTTDKPVVVLDENYTVFTDRWKLRDPETEAIIAEINSKSILGHLFSLYPHEYEITDADGTHVGTIDGQFSLKDEYVVRIDDASTVPKEAIVAAAMVIDAIEGN
jgi:uncharacterized protein YxjI